MAEPLTPERIAELRAKLEKGGAASLWPHEIGYLLDAAEQAVTLRAENERLRNNAARLRKGVESTMPSLIAKNFRQKRNAERMRAFIEDVADGKFSSAISQARQLLAELDQEIATLPKGGAA